jgi:hypothetical protein
MKNMVSEKSEKIKISLGRETTNDKAADQAQNILLEDS